MRRNAAMPKKMFQQQFLDLLVDFMYMNLKDKDYITAYRKYYQGAKAYFAKWEKGVFAPEWWVSV